MVLFGSCFTTVQKIYIIPLGNVSEKSIAVVKKNIENFYHVEVIIDSPVAISADILTKSKLRLDASKILKKFFSLRNTLILTEQDIAHHNKERGIEEWGIFGLGMRPGKVCVISTFRLKRNATDQLFYERLAKVCIHEIGHNLGLPHCTFDKKCLMNDAHGTIKQVDEESFYFCEKCKEKLE